MFCLTPMFARDDAAGGSSALGLDVAGFGQRDLGQQRADEFEDHNGEQHDVSDQGAVLAEHEDLQRHSERDACLREQGNAEVFDDVRLAVHHLGKRSRAEAFSDRSYGKEQHADHDDRKVGEHEQVEFRAGQHEEQYEQRRRPTVDTFHQFFGEFADVDEHGAEHHADQQRREADFERSEREFELGKRHTQKDDGDRDRHTLGTRMEVLLEEIEEQPQQRAEYERENDLDDGVDDDRNDVHGAVFDRAGDSERHGEEYQANRVVQSDDRQKQIDQRAFRLVLTDDHQRCGGRRCGCDRSERDRGGEGKFVGHCKV